MNKIVLVILFFVTVQMTLMGQSFSVGAAGIYGDEIEKSGVQLRGYYNLKGNRVCFGPEFTVFAAKKESLDGEEITENLRELNFNIHYVIELSEKWGVYPLLGYNASFEKEEIETGTRVEEIRHTEHGANLGFGVHRPVNRWIFFAEYDHLFSELSQNSFLLGFFINLGKHQTEHQHE